LGWTLTESGEPTPTYPQLPRALCELIVDQTRPPSIGAQSCMNKLSPPLSRRMRRAVPFTFGDPSLDVSIGRRIPSAYRFSRSLPKMRLYALMARGVAACCNGSRRQMWDSLQQAMQLPGGTPPYVGPRNTPTFRTQNFALTVIRKRRARLYLVSREIDQAVQMSADSSLGRFQ